MDRLLIVGLGNPGVQYDRTRHNFGFLAVEAYAAEHGGQFRRTRFGMVAETDQAFILKPATFMNLSGDAVGPFSRFYRIVPGGIVVACDDLDLPLGTLRIRRSGSSGGHNGLKSIAAALGTGEFVRLRLGISRPSEETPVIDWVLGRFSSEERVVVKEVVARAVQALASIVDDGVETAMSRFNGTNNDRGENGRLLGE